MTSQMFIPIHRKILLVVACIAIIAGCAGFERQSKPAAVRATGLKPTRDCQVEADALAIHS